MKKIVLTSTLVIGIILSAVYAVFSYIFIDRALLTMLGQTKPSILVTIENLQRSIPREFVNQVGLSLLVVLGVIGITILISQKSVGKKSLLLALAIPCLLSFAYPTVSRDIFSYLYYAKMVLVHHQNPYLVLPLANSSTDLWLGFIHNVDRTYAYGPIALLISVLPMILAGGEKLIVNIYLLKMISLFFFLVGAWLLLKLTKNKNLVVILWILNPFILNELLINGHNDLMMIVFFWLAIYLKERSKTLWSLLTYSLSVGTKFLTAPLLPILFLREKLQIVLSTILIVAISGYLIYHSNLPWYYSWIYFCLPYTKLTKLQIFSILLLQLSLTLGYAGFLETGLWGPPPSSLVILMISKATRIFIPLFLLASFLRPYTAPTVSYTKRHDGIPSKAKKRSRGSYP